MRRIQRIHLVGIGGSGMGGIAEVLLNLGYRVQGSDLKAQRRHRSAWRASAPRSSSATAPSTSGDADVVVVSSAVSRATTRKWRRRSRRRIPVVPRAEMLGELMRFR